MDECRECTPQGVSPEDEWHGPYEVVRGPGTGRYFVVDNADRYASVLPLKGFATLDAASKSRDYIDSRRAAREHGKALAEHIFTSTMAILDPLGTAESRHSQRAMDAAQRLLDTYGDPQGIRYDQDDDPYVRVDATDGSGWFVVDYGYDFLRVRHVADPNQDQDRIEIVGGQASSFTTVGSKPTGWNRTHTQTEIDTWVAELGDEYARHVPEIVRWTRRRER